eukprot:CAMPEP_0167767202 /NCGR_PEP_ID=MMETSP0110_2-20121227/15886_1 /TAXON_ID=629695 /ORGANISM="Gymnochlora sp., Strain CCMP2014" /LENGTH=227 /DNA_ID=CAMNT_0007655549 /DNA_START=163 /DNA_END=847 /DNA_ORIENTATION=-
MESLGKDLNENGYKGNKKMQFGVHSIELWDDKQNLIAGDIGYTVGACYTSMTGFREEGTVSAGTVQLVATCSLLKERGFAFWDLGMVMKYKTGLGADTMDRLSFLKRLHKVRDEEKCSLVQDSHRSASELIKKLRDDQKSGNKEDQVNKSSSSCHRMNSGTKTIRKLCVVNSDKKGKKMRLQTKSATNVSAVKVGKEPLEESDKEGKLQLQADNSKGGTKGTRGEKD